MLHVSIFYKLSFFYKLPPSTPKFSMATINNLCTTKKKYPHESSARCSICLLVDLFFFLWITAMFW